MKTKNETVIETKGTHNHECDPGERKAKVVNQIKRRAQYSTPTVAITKESFEISDDYAVQLIEREQFEESVVEKMDELAIYYKSTYIENPIVNKKPPFPIEMWNQYDAAGEGVARKTNSVEGWHYGLQAYFSGSTPNIWLLLRTELGKGFENAEV